jgi:hypothetical protein
MNPSRGPGQRADQGPAAAFSPLRDAGVGRESWSPQTRDSYRSKLRPGPNTAEFDLVRNFYLRLIAEIQGAERTQCPLAILILQLPLRPTERWRQQQLEHRLRAGVRGNDIASHLSDTTFAVALPGTGKGAAVVAARLERRLSEVADGRVITGVAHWPRDGQTALELLRTAIRRSLVALPGRQMDPELEQLVGKLTP